ncbi:MAG: rhombosortase [Planctomycetaceae bacterium]
MQPRYQQTETSNRFPIVALCIAGAALAVGAFDSVADLLQFDRSAIEAGQSWRLLTGHLTHWSWDHVFWDLAVFAVLGSLCERENRARFVACVAASAILISAGVWCVLPGLETYRGLSGIDSALFALLAGSVLRDAIAERRWSWLVGTLLLLAGFLGKTVFEIATGTTLFVDSAAANMLPIPLAHIIGAVVGLGLGIAPNRRKTQNNDHPRDCTVTIASSPSLTFG